MQTENENGAPLTGGPVDRSVRPATVEDRAIYDAIAANYRNGSPKPLFIPLKTEFFEAFATGTKTVEYRQYGPRWNERSCTVGRDVVLSKGYGTKNRMRGRVVGFECSIEPTKTEAWRKCYGDKVGAFAACITIELLPNAAVTGGGANE